MVGRIDPVEAADDQSEGSKKCSPGSATGCGTHYRGEDILTLFGGNAVLGIGRFAATRLPDFELPAVVEITDRQRCQNEQQDCTK